MPRRETAKFKEFGCFGNRSFTELIDLCQSGEVREAFERCKKLIDSYVEGAFSFAGVLCEFGGPDFPIRLSDAKFYYEKGIEWYEHPIAYLGLGRIYLYGKGVPVDYDKAQECFLQAISISDEPSDHLYLGKMAFMGQGQQADPDKAQQYFERAFELGNVFGLTYLGLLDCSHGRNLRGWGRRLKAGWLAMREGAR